MALDTCRLCETRFTSRVEALSELCARCIPEEVGRLRKDVEHLKNEGERSDVLLTRMREKTEQVGQALQLRLDLDQAERDGRTASSNGVPLGECPHPSGSNHETFWRVGWQTWTLSVDAARMRTLIIWMMEQIAVVREVAKGSGAIEVSEKLDTVFLAALPFVEDLIDVKAG